MRILIAPNSFKHSAGATDVAAAIAHGLDRSDLRGTWKVCPVGDGGDGTAALLVRQLGGVTKSVAVADPLGRTINAAFGYVEERRLAVIELADASGLRLLQATELNPLRAGTRGTGQLVSCALNHGARHIVLGIGGSATVDGAAGLLRALGARFLDRSGTPLGSLPEGLLDLHSIDVSALDPRLSACSLTVLCDVKNPLLGPRGAAAVFGPQKGATPAMVARLDAALARLAEVILQQTGIPIGEVERGGAAGGVAAGLFGMLNAQLVNGIDYFLQLVDFDAQLDGVDVVITGEGSIDDQTMDGKGPWGVAIKAKSRGAFVVGLAGAVPLKPSSALLAKFDALIAIGNAPVPLSDALRSTTDNLSRVSRDLGNTLAFTS